MFTIDHIHFLTAKLSIMITYTFGEIKKLWKVKTVSKNKFKVKETTYFSGELTTLGKLTAFLLFSNGSKTRFVYPHCCRSSRQPTQRTMTALSCLVPSLKFLGTMKVIFVQTNVTAVFSLAIR